jgi:hypothetical protein
MKKFKIKERKVLFASNETLNNEPLDTESILLKIRRKYGLINDKLEATAEFDHSISSVDDPNGALKMHHISSNHVVKVENTKTDVPKSLFNLTEPMQESIEDNNDICISLNDALPEDAKLNDAKQSRTASTKHPQKSHIGAVELVSTDHFFTRSLKDIFSGSILSEPISYTSTPRQSIAQNYLKDEFLNEGGFMSTCDVDENSMNSHEVALDTSVKNNIAPTTLDCEFIPTDTLLRPMSTSEQSKMPPNYCNVSIQTDLVSDGLSNSSSVKDENEEQLEEISLKIEQDTIQKKEDGKLEIQNLVLGQTACDLLHMKDGAKSVNIGICMNDGQPSPLSAVVTEIPPFYVDAQVQTAVLPNHSCDTGCQSDPPELLLVSVESQTDHKSVASEEIQTIPIFFPTASTGTQTGSQQFDYQKAWRLTLSLDSDDESKRWLRKRLFLKLKSLE